jgi:RND family efflux transporter MFP subunit
MEQARQQYETALLDLKATETFYRQGNASQAEVNRARSAAAGAKAAFERAQKSFEDTSVKAPIFGAVAWKTETAALGNYLSPSVQVARLVDLSRIKVELSFGERQIGLVREGAEATIFADAACGEGGLPGRVTAVSAGSDLATGSYSVIVEAENRCDGSLLAGMSVRVRIPVRGEEPEIIVPDSAVVVREGREYVFVENGGTAEPREIERGGTVGNRTEILSGVEPGDRLIVSGLSALKPGSRIRGTVIGKTGEVL